MYATPFQPKDESIFLTNDRAFITNGRDFHDDRSRFSSSLVEIFIMIGRDFHHDRSRFSS